MNTTLPSLLEKTIQHLSEELSGISVGRANPGIIEHIEVPVYGASQPIKNLANISCPDIQTIRVEPWDKSVIGAMEKAIRDADIGLNPQNMGDALFLPVPPLTEERRKQVVKKVKEIGEESKIAVRNIRHDVLKTLKKQKEDKLISEDEALFEEKKVQEKVDETNKKIEEKIKEKEKDILSPS